MHRSRGNSIAENSISKAEDFLNDSIERLNPLKPSNIYTEPGDMYSDVYTMPVPSYMDKKHNNTQRLKGILDKKRSMSIAKNEQMLHSFRPGNIGPAPSKLKNHFD